MNVPGRGEGGYALIAAVAAILLFSLVALTLVEDYRGRVGLAIAEVDDARLTAATDAGMALALASLVDAGPVGPPPLDGRARRLRYGDAALTIAIQDESGKVPLNALDEEQARRLFALLGVSGERLDIVTDSFLDWTDDDDDARSAGAEEDFYATKHLRPRNGALKSIEETALIRGFDARLVQRLQAIGTVHFGRGAFRPELASPTAIEALEGPEEGAIDLINRKRVIAGQDVALAIGQASSLSGHVVTISVRAELDDGASRSRHVLVDLANRGKAPYYIREGQ